MHKILFKLVTMMEIETTTINNKNALSESMEFAQQKILVE